MISSIFEYESILNNAIVQGENLLSKINEARNKLAYGDEQDLADTNYASLIYSLERSVADLYQQRVRYKYDKMDRDEFDVVLKNVSEGKPTFLITVGKEHAIRTIDNIHKLSVLYNVNPEFILNYNKISKSEFYDLKERNAVIKIPITVNIQVRSNYSDLMTFGSIDGKKAWGVDCPNTLVIGPNGDLKVLGYQETLIQGIINKFGDYGDIPGYEDQTIDLDWGRDYDSNLIDALTIAKLQQKLKIDKRVAKVTDIQINTISNQQAKIVNIYILPLNGEKSILAEVSKSNNIEIG